jgi:outer membrane protein OmpA-like peptidoglycan-associated protein
MKKGSLLFMLFSCLPLLMLGQQNNEAQNAKAKMKKLVNSKVTVKNAAAINSKNLEFSPTYYQNGIVFVKSHEADNRLDKNIGIPFFELFYAELDGQGNPGQPLPFSSKVNTSTHEGPVAFNFTEDILYYTSNSKEKGNLGKYSMKIYEAQRGGEDWENNRELSFNHNDFSSMHPSLNANGRKLFFASNRPGGYGGTDIYYVEKKGNSWGTPINLGPNVNTNKNEAFPFIHESGMLFFSSEGLKGLGGYDIFAVNTSKATITEIIHLGKPFNSPNADFGLILNPTGTQGFFSSSRTDGMGQDDIYQFETPTDLFESSLNFDRATSITVVNEADKQALPNAGIYIFEKNKSGLFGEDELYEVVLEAKEDNPDEMEVRFVMKKELGQPDYYTNNEGLATVDLASNKEYLLLVTKKGFANQKFHYSTLKQSAASRLQIPLKAKNCITLRGEVLHKKTGEAIQQARIFIKSKCSDQLQFTSTDAKGKYEYCLAFDCEYTVSVEKAGYNIEKMTVSTKDGSKTSLLSNFYLNNGNKDYSFNTANLEEGATIVLENIYYDFNKSAIRAGAAAELDALVLLMQQYPSMEIELIAYTDARGEALYNQQLSRARALSARNYLFAKGVEKHRVSATGKGETSIRNHCKNGVTCSDKEHEYNRRTEVRITKLTEKVGVFHNGRE